jgi:hypothetical protein
MNIISLSGEDISLFSPSSKLIVFDILYVEDMKEKKISFDKLRPIKQIESEVFEWSDGMLLGEYNISDKCKSLTISLKDIKDYTENINVPSDSVFGTDTGVIVIIDWSSIDVFLNLFDYDDFIEIITDRNEVERYIQKISDMIGSSFSIISTQGVDKGNDFIGSGRYYIEHKCFI